MPVDRYILPVADESAARQEVDLRDLSFGYEGLAVVDDAGLWREIESEPGDDPPTGWLPAYDESGTQHLIPFEIAEIQGIYELTANALNAHIEVRLEQDLGLEVAYENAPYTVPEPTSGVIWCSVLIDWASHEQVAFGADTGRYHLHGDLILTLFTPINDGMADILSTAQSVIEAMRSQQIDHVRTYDSYHLPIQRDGSWWSCEIRTEFRAERDYVNP